MTQADRVHSTPPTNTSALPVDPTRRRFLTVAAVGSKPGCGSIANFRKRSLRATSFRFDGSTDVLAGGIGAQGAGCRGECPRCSRAHKPTGEAAVQT